jgi:peptide chain release factor subunit 1
MMREEDLRELADLHSAASPVLSVYLNVAPRGRGGEAAKVELRVLLGRAAAQGAAPADLARVERFFEHEYDRQGRGVAVFACDGAHFWRAYALPAPLQSMVHVGRRAYVKPLSDVWDDYDRFGVIMVDREGARGLVFHLGSLEDASGTMGAEVRRHKQGGWASQKLQRYEDQEAHHNLRDAAEWAQHYVAEHGVKRVVLAGTDETVAEFRALLSRPLLDTVVGQLNLDMNATPSEVWDHAFEVTQEAQRQSEAELLEQVISAAHTGGAGAIGLADTLAAVQQGRAYQLLVDPEVRRAGFQCAGCGALLLEAGAACPYCGGTMVPTADVVNLVIGKAIDAGLKVSALEHNPRLVNVGQIAAALRY